MPQKHKNIINISNYAIKIEEKTSYFICFLKQMYATFLSHSRTLQNKLVNVTMFWLQVFTTFIIVQQRQGEGV